MLTDEDNSLCEICFVHQEDISDLPTFDIYWINHHCINLRRNREARKNKNYKPTNTVF